MFDEIFMEINGVGELYVEINLIVENSPTLFVCKTTNNERYIFVTQNKTKCEYILAKIDKEMLIRMLKNEITIKNTFCSSNYIYKTYLDENKRFQIFREKTFSPYEYIWPVENENLKQNNKAIKNYIHKLEGNPDF